MLCRHGVETGVGMSLPDRDALDAVDRLASRFFARGGQPGLAYGVVAGGRLVHDGARGERALGGPEPDADTVFRIASMTKSFTAALLLLLRDEGRLALDDPVAAYVPELDAVRGPSADAPALTVRHLLTMSGGLPTDDPWGDRQQSLPLEDFRALLRGGLTFAWTPGTAFEYSNLGYAVLGLVAAAAGGGAYHELVATRLLAPAGHAGDGVRGRADPARPAGHRPPAPGRRVAAGPVRPHGCLRADGRAVQQRA
jgi:CubicO group peptidase (beta-lactamase class C family)